MTGAMRYPADSRDQIDNLPTRNPTSPGGTPCCGSFAKNCGRAGGPFFSRWPTIRGLGGVGKTQVALEYAHRFKDDYDIVWWLNCDPPQYVDASLVDLGKRLREVLRRKRARGGRRHRGRHAGAAVPGRAGGRALAAHLRQRGEHRGDPETCCPSGGGHVLITSRNEKAGRAERPQQDAAARLLRARGEHQPPASGGCPPSPRRRRMSSRRNSATCPWRLPRRARCSPPRRCPSPST